MLSIRPIKSPLKCNRIIFKFITGSISSEKENSLNICRKFRAIKIYSSIFHRSQELYLEIKNDWARKK